jgi:plasmid stabilization system protein ParE
LTSVVLRPAAAADIEDAYHWYESQRPGLGDELLDEIQATLQRIEARPRLHAVVHRDTRRALLHRFPYAVFFRDMADVIVVVACFHVKRDPRRWRDRR